MEGGKPVGPRTPGWHAEGRIVVLRMPPIGVALRRPRRGAGSPFRPVLTGRIDVVGRFRGVDPAEFGLFGRVDARRRV